MNCYIQSPISSARPLECSRWRILSTYQPILADQPFIPLYA